MASRSRSSSRRICRSATSGSHAASADRRIHLSLSGVPIFAEAGRFTGYRGIGRDLTLLKRAEHELAETTTLLRGTLDNIEQGLLVVDADLRIRLWNDRLWQLFRHSPNELRVGRPVAELIFGSTAPDTARGEESLGFFRRCVAERQTFTRDLSMSDGRVFSMRLVPMPEGGAIATYRDITQRVQVLQDLTATTSLLRATLDNMEQGLLVLDAELKIRVWNERLERLFSHMPGNLRVGRSIVDVIQSHAGEERGLAASGLAFLRRGVEQRQPASREMTMPTGRVIEMRINAHARRRAPRDLSRRHRPQAHRDRSAPRQGRGRARKPQQERVPGQHEPRAADAAERHHRLRRHPQGRDFRQARRSALSSTTPPTSATAGTIC